MRSLWIMGHVDARKRVELQNRFEALDEGTKTIGVKLMPPGVPDTCAWPQHDGEAMRSMSEETLCFAGGVERPEHGKKMKIMGKCEITIDSGAEE